MMLLTIPLAKEALWLYFQKISHEKNPHEIYIVKNIIVQTLRKFAVVHVEYFSFPKKI